MISNLHEEGLKTHEFTLKLYEKDSKHTKFIEITQNYVQTMIS